MNNEIITTFAMRLLVVCYVYAILLSSANVATCVYQKTVCGCDSKWAQATAVSAGAISTIWAYITESPVPRRRRDQNKKEEDLQ